MTNRPTSSTPKTRPCPISSEIKQHADPRAGDGNYRVVCRLNCMNNFGGVCRHDSVSQVQGSETAVAALYGVRVADVQRATQRARLALVADRFTSEVFSTPLMDVEPHDCKDFVEVVTSNPDDFNTWNLKAKTQFTHVQVRDFLLSFCRLI